MRAIDDEITIPVTTDATVSATAYLPSDEIIAVAVIHPATATPQRFYAALAQYLAGRGIAAVTYDYRGTGRSGDPRTHSQVRMRDWMDQDVPAVAAWARGRFAGLPQYAIGHSLGGHALALGSGSDGLEAFAMVASHAGVTATIPDRGERLRVGAFFALAPTLSDMLGYTPARVSGFGVDMPAGVIRDWAPWTRTPGYFFDDPTMRAAHRMAAVDRPVLALGASDDSWATPEQIDAITDHLTAAPLQRRTYTPADVGAQRVGHHGLLRRGAGESVWDQICSWLLRHGA